MVLSTLRSIKNRLNCVASNDFKKPNLQSWCWFCKQTRCLLDACKHHMCNSETVRGSTSCKDLVCWRVATAAWCLFDSSSSMPTQSLLHAHPAMPTRAATFDEDGLNPCQPKQDTPQRVTAQNLLEKMHVLQFWHTRLPLPPILYIFR